MPSSYHLFNGMDHWHVKIMACAFEADPKADRRHPGWITWLLGHQSWLTHNVFAAEIHACAAQSVDSIKWRPSQQVYAHFLTIPYLCVAVYYKPASGTPHINLLLKGCNCSLATNCQMAGCFSSRGAMTLTAMLWICHWAWSCIAWVEHRQCLERAFELSSTSSSTQGLSCLHAP